MRTERETKFEKPDSPGSRSPCSLGAAATSSCRFAHLLFSGRACSCSEGENGSGFRWPVLNYAPVFKQSNICPLGRLLLLSKLLHLLSPQPTVPHDLRSFACQFCSLKVPKVLRSIGKSSRGSRKTPPKLLFLPLVQAELTGGGQTQTFVLARVMNCKVNRLQAIMQLPRSSLCSEAVDNVRARVQLQTSATNRKEAQQTRVGFF